MYDTFASTVKEPGLKQEPSIDSTRAQTSDFSAGTRTGDWFAVDEVDRISAVPSLVPPPLLPAAQGPGPRRRFARLVACLVIGGTFGCLVLSATRTPVRRAILEWSSFGLSERLHGRGSQIAHAH